ncbi:hypothetical protein [Actinomadura atramentaria]|uniref:hypothetical protein n=1 Tax=Actinomadura atramentaria TaxID=1990 RepID=UPI0003698D62|nr:hypothetical protein [Actinomadura atramentaria]
MSEDAGRIFRQAWIDGVRKHFPGEPKPGYVAPWEEMPEWERDAARTVFCQVASFIELGATDAMTREQKGRFVALCWIAQVHKHLPHPKPSYVADWNDLPAWQRETDADIFETIAKH